MADLRYATASHHFNEASSHLLVAYYSEGKEFHHVPWAFRQMVLAAEALGFKLVPVDEANPPPYWPLKEE